MGDLSIVAVQSNLQECYQKQKKSCRFTADREKKRPDETFCFMECSVRPQHLEKITRDYSLAQFFSYWSFVIFNHTADHEESFYIQMYVLFLYNKPFY